MNLISVTRIFLLAIFGFLVVGCATQVYPPVAPAKPMTIYLCDYGFHSSLLLPNGDGRFVEYVYGDWAYAVLNENDPMHTLGALFWSPQPALGRRYLSPKAGESFPLPPNRPIVVSPLFVDGGKEAATVKKMNERFQKHIDTALLNAFPDYGFLFIKDDEHYSIIHSCNHLTVRLLREMGCCVKGFPIFSNFIVETPGNATAATSVRFGK